MKTDRASILKNERIAKSTFRMDIQTRLAPDCQPGQFMQVKVPGFFLRRPISIAWIESGTISLIYKTVGEGTMVLSRLKPGDDIDLFGPLGHGFPVEERPVTLVGGGVGVPPLLETARQYIGHNQPVQVVLGFATKEDIFGNEIFQDLGCEVFIATMDGSLGTQGTVIDAINNHSVRTDFILGCGPLPMLRALNDYPGWLSFEARMACGMGACMGCVIETRHGLKRVCKDGPVFPAGEVLF